MVGVAWRCDPARKLLSSLGHEPFDAALTPEFLRARLRGRRTPIKCVLLAGDVVVGAGNIYACEALLRRRHRPAHAGRPHRADCARRGCWRPCARSSAARMALGGSTLRDFRDAHGAAGAYQARSRGLRP